MDVNLKTTLLGWTPLHYAVLSDHNHVLDYLISHGADINCKTGIPNWDAAQRHETRKVQDVFMHRDVTEI